MRELSGAAGKERTENRKQRAAGQGFMGSGNQVIWQSMVQYSFLEKNE
jgi:hypothetical protein